MVCRQGVLSRMGPKSKACFMRLSHLFPSGNARAAAGFRGTALGLFAAVCYGFIPFFTLPISHQGDPADKLPDISILFYRFLFAALVLGALLLVRRVSFRISRGEAVTLLYLAFISDGSALFLLAGYNYMPSGVATTIHFMYPVVTAVVMMLFYHEARRYSTLLAVTMAVLGVAVLSWPDTQNSISLRGVIIVLISAVCYALYIIRVNRSRARDMDSGKLTFYVMFFGACIFGAEALRQHHLEPLTTLPQVAHLGALAVVCTVVTNLCVVAAVKRVGSTMVSVLGAFEPLTAVVVGTLVFGEPFTAKVLLGILLIVPAVVMIIFTRSR